jgi:hypothetical protein
MTHNDSAIIARIIELAPLYDSETMSDQAGTIPGEEEWGYTLINFCLDHLQEEFPGIDRDQFTRCYLDAYEQTDQWRRTDRGVRS